MSGPRSDLARFAFVVLRLAYDCSSLRDLLDPGEGLGGQFTNGLLMTIGVIGAFWTKGRIQRFFTGYLYACVAQTFALLPSTETLVSRLYLIPSQWLLGWVYANVPRPWVETPIPAAGGTRFTIAFLFLTEAIFSLPFLVLALAGGLTALAVGRFGRSNPAPGPKLT